ncbi:hemagglutinin repeat-containing protein, partial [bacterium endosymbiont of Bathymodiolus sp. 5 South]|uniref:hemagglutinin repeat-containing protein n=1 Tax=bacterium endosymbiont of Bathymodiolus sp. 5 South TaxID=1181670 RepID=UPI00111AED7F
MPNPFVISILTLITTLAITPTIANTNLNTLNKTTTAPNSTTTKALAPNLNTINQLNIQAKAIDIQAGYNGSLNESYHKTSGLSLGGLVGIGPLYTSTEDLEGRIKKTAVNSTLSGNNITLNANNNINAAGVDIQADNSISGTAKDINIQNVNNTDTHYSKHKKVKVSLADVLGTIAKNPLLLKKESDGKVSFTLATATID